MIAALHDDLDLYLYCFTVAAVLTGDQLYDSDSYADTTYYLRMRQYKYTWREAQQSCGDRNNRIARVPIPSNILNGFSQEVSIEINTNIWIAQANGGCLTLKRDCKAGKLRLLPFGGTRCDEYEFNSEATDCGSGRMLYVICETRMYHYYNEAFVIVIVIINFFPSTNL